VILHTMVPSKVLLGQLLFWGILFLSFKILKEAAQAASLRSTSEQIIAKLKCVMKISQVCSISGLLCQMVIAWS